MDYAYVYLRFTRLVLPTGLFYYTFTSVTAPCARVPVAAHTHTHARFTVGFTFAVTLIAAVCLDSAVPTPVTWFTRPLRTYTHTGCGWFTPLRLQLRTRYTFAVVYPAVTYRYTFGCAPAHTFSYAFTVVLHTLHRAYWVYVVARLRLPLPFPRLVHDYVWLPRYGLLLPWIVRLYVLIVRLYIARC